PFESVGDGFSQSSPAMFPTASEDTFDFFRRDERTRRVMHRHVADILSELTETNENGVLPTFAACDNRSDLLRVVTPHDLFDLIKSVLARDDYDLSHTIRAFKRINDVGEHR